MNPIKLSFMNRYQKKKKRKIDRKKHRKTKKIENKRKRAQQMRKKAVEPIEEELTLFETALNNHLSSYQINGDGSDYKSFLENKKKIVLDLINKQKKPIKMRLKLNCNLYKKGENGNIITCNAGFLKQQM